MQKQVKKAPWNSALGRFSSEGHVLESWDHTDRQGLSHFMAPRGIIFTQC